MKILNLYCGLGGNRTLWGDEHEVTAVEIDADIAKIYQDRFPDDTVVIGDAHKFLALWNEYRMAKNVTKRRLYLETLSDVIPKMEKIYVVDEGVKGLMPILGIAPSEGVLK